MMERRCEAEIHAPDCDGRGTTRDHFTPRCIAKLLGWSSEQIGSPENIQYLSQACHVLKDRSTPLRFQLLRSQLSKGHWVGLGDHQRYAKKRYRNPVI